MHIVFCLLFIWFIIELLLIGSLNRNSASESIKQKLVFVGSEEGKLLALRQTFEEVQPDMHIPDDCHLLSHLDQFFFLLNGTYYIVSCTGIWHCVKEKGWRLASTGCFVSRLN